MVALLSDFLARTRPPEFEADSYMLVLETERGLLAEQLTVQSVASLTGFIVYHVLYRVTRNHEKPRPFR